MSEEQTTVPVETQVQQPEQKPTEVVTTTEVPKNETVNNVSNDIKNDTKMDNADSHKVDAPANDPPQADESKLTSSPQADAPADNVQSGQPAASEQGAAPDQSEEESEFGKPIGTNSNDEMDVHAQMKKASEFLKTIPGKFRLY